MKISLKDGKCFPQFTLSLHYLCKTIFPTSIIMKHFTTALLAITILAACTSPSQHRRGQFTRVLDHAQEQNLAYDSITNVDSIRMVVDYFNRHGSANEQMRANYIIARAYDDMGEKPAALHFFQEAAERADTTAEDCDYKTLSRIHGHLAYLFLHQSSPLNALDEFEMSEKYSTLCNDTMASLASLTYRARVYELLNKPDSAVAIAKRARDAYDSIREDSLAAMAMGAVIDILLEKGEYEEARVFFNRYEGVKGLFDDKQNIKKGLEIYYYLKGLYFLKTNHTDSATFFFNKLLREAKNSNHKECANYGLAQVYQKLGKNELGLKHAMLAYALNDSTHRELATTDYQRNQAQYNYTRLQRIAEKESAKARRAETKLTVIVLVLAVFFLLTTIVILRLRKKQKEAKKREQEMNDRYARLQLAKTELEDLNANYNKEKSILENEMEEMKEALIQIKEHNDEERQTIDEVLKLALVELERTRNENESEIAERIEEKQEEIDLLEAELESYNKKNIIRLKSKQFEKLRSAPISLKFFKYGNNETKGRPTTEDWAELRQLINDTIPGFFVKINGGSQIISDDDVKLCMMVRLQMPMYAIINITGRTKNSISNARRRVLGKIFGKKKGGAQEFDRLLLKL